MKILPVINQYKTYNNSSLPCTKPIFGSSEGDAFVKSSENIFPLKEITSKTAQKLYSLDYTPISEPREGYFLTYVFDRNTFKPVDIYVKQLYSRFLSPKKPSLNEEKYCFYREMPNGELSLVGTRWITLDTVNKKISPGFMESKDKTLLGLGLREQQVAFERMMDYGYDNVNIISVQDAYDFHSKCGFKSTDYLIYRSGHHIDDFIDNWAKRLKSDLNTVRKMLIFQAENGVTYLNINKTLENFVIYINKHGLKVADDIGIDMKLTPGALVEWDILSKAKPILLNKLKVF